MILQSPYVFLHNVRCVSLIHRDEARRAVATLLVMINCVTQNYEKI